MGQKIHPLGLRLGTTQTHRATWCTLKHIYPHWFKEDLVIRKFLLKKYPTARIVDILIVRQPTKSLKLKRKLNQQTNETKQQLNQQIEEKPAWLDTDPVRIFIHTPYITKIVGVEAPRAQLNALCWQLVDLCQAERAKWGGVSNPVTLKVFLRPVDNPYTEASIIADDLIEQLEERKSFRAALKKTLFRVKINNQKFRYKGKQKKQNANRLKGIRIQISGRLNGAEIARIEWRRNGRIPLHTLRADVGYVAKTAKTIHGILGIKVWTFTKEKF